MRRRSRLEASIANGRSRVRRYLFYSAMTVLSLALPAALTLLGSGRSPPSKSSAYSSAQGRPAIGDSGGTHSSAAGNSGTPQGWRNGLGRPLGPSQGIVSPLVWRGIGDGIASAPVSADDIHIVFSTDCSPYQNYQSILMFHSAEEVEQRGPVTRVASGCTKEEQAELRKLMDKQPDRFRIHFTPDYSIDPDTGKRFAFYNKPNGMAHFLKNADPPVTEAVVALIDPDMILMSKLTPKVDDVDKMLWHDPRHASGPDWVVEGVPVGQFYGLGAAWAIWPDLPDITKSLGEDTPARQVSLQSASADYPVGPPYLMHPRDWARVLDLWVAMSPEVYKRHPGILAEMYGFCIAAAHLRLRHRVAYGLMVSDSRMADKEGWPMVDALGKDACTPSAIDHRRGSLPPVIHYCQMYRVGTYFWGKRHKSHHDFFACDSDSLQLPPPAYLGSPMGTVRVHPLSGSKETFEHVPAEAGVRQGYILCAVLRAMNAALASHKALYCRPEEVAGNVRRFTDLSPAQLSEDLYAGDEAGTG